MSIIERTYPTNQIDPNTFYFISEGKEGSFTLVARFEQRDITTAEGEVIITYNFGYANVEEISGRLVYDDTILIGNGDAFKTFRTLALGIQTFLNRNPSAIIYFTGSTPKRTFVYGLLISKYYDQIASEVSIHIFDSDSRISRYNKDTESNVIAFLITKINR